MRTLRIGSRDSKLAVRQANIVKTAIEAVHHDTKVEIITMKTTGDIILNQSLDKIGGKGLFVKELDQALMEKRIDLSVHSLKDMPMDISEELPILAFTKREDPRDALIFKPGKNGISEGGVVGTSSRRRMIQLRRLYPKCVFKGIRGNVETRLKKLREQNFEGTVLAMAGLARLHMTEVAGRVFSTEEVVPAAGQGILAVQGRKGEDGFWKECIHCPESEIAALGERAFIRVLDGGCSSPIAAYGKVLGNELKLTGLYFRESDESFYIEHKVGSIEKAQQMGEQLAKEMQKKYE
ncbi:hydroxymethylbilane synthase [Aequitasia blattaphilus]|uniref:Porphobilinogen deaminase n=1 Tax=Aequitasia blattaphilus TaxID=2949332 RepID=A0ABT1E8K7_9FIRM|nr:hydroxymethylbilane synthase [Aequitasia blattaphilus]MCP1102163.1 hydroxymethylbilane synthase [Aequitasia blattaphilus]MCR8614803.1 hydroxymethylbilane synthase [Aequitasia blattaphilus]